MADAGIRQLSLVRLLRNTDRSVERFTTGDWNQVLRQARRTNLLSRAACLLEERGDLDKLPRRVATHFQSALYVADSSHRSTLWEVRQIHEALAGAGIPFILLKGGAYAVTGAAPSHGRIFSDIDIMVDAGRLTDTERTLMQHGWMSSNLNAYDQKYYRKWMHELPPMQHLKRQTSIDVHHTILPPTAKLKPKVDLLWGDAVELENYPGVFVLSDEDMILHSAVHLFHDGDFDQGLRDLVDIDALLSQNANDNDFRDSLIERAERQDLSRPLYYALRYVKKFLGAQIPETYLERIRKNNRASSPTVVCMDWLITRAMRPSLLPNPGFKTQLANWLLYVRSHYLRMPMYLLVPHLVRKAYSKSESK